MVLTAFEAAERLGQKAPTPGVTIHLENILSGLEELPTLAYLDESEAGKWVWSLLVWDLSEGKGGEKYALNMLFLLMNMDCFFFLGQPWLRKLLSSWREQPDRRKVNHVFFGTGKRGVNSYERIREDERRNDVIVGAIEERLQKGVGTNEAMQQVAKGLGQLGIKARLS